MKSFFLSLTVIMTSVSVLAWVSTPTEIRPHSFRFSMGLEKFDYTTKAASYEEAFEKAAQACFQHFKAGRRVSEDRGLDIIDVCANPRQVM